MVCEHLIPADECRVVGCRGEYESPRPWMGLSCFRVRVTIEREGRNAIRLYPVITATSAGVARDRAVDILSESWDGRLAADIIDAEELHPASLHYNEHATWPALADRAARSAPDARGGQATDAIPAGEVTPASGLPFVLVERDASDAEPAA